MTSRRVALSTAFLTLAAGGTAACDDASDFDQQNEVFYCADANGTVVDEDYCDDDDSRGGGGALFFLWHSTAFRPGYGVGQKLPPGGSRFAYNDQKSRTAFGLPATGKVGNGTVKTNVVGKGGGATKSGSGAKGSGSSSGG